MIREFYRYAEVEEPDWINEFIAEDRYSENSEEKVANVRSYMLNHINNTIAKISRKSLTLPLENKIIQCYTNHLVPWLEYNPDTEEVIVRREIIYELKEKYGIGSQQLLVEIFNWNFKKEYWTKKSAKNMSCVHVNMKTL